MSEGPEPTAGVAGRAVRALSSLELTSAALLYLFGLVLAATLHQAGHTTRETTDLLIHAWFVAVGPLPLPAGQLVFAILAVNLSLALVTRLPWRWDRAGLVLVHLSLIVLVAGGLVSRFFVRESIVVLAEGDAEAYSYDLDSWQLVVATRGEQTRHPVDEPPRTIGGREVEIIAHVEHARTRAAGPADVESVTGARAAVEVQRVGDTRRPALVLRIGARTILLHGGDPRAFQLDDATELRLAPRRYRLPATIRLTDFRAEFFDGTRTPRSFTSEVRIVDEGTARPATIAMNRPLRIGQHTIYQLGYDDRTAGDEVSFLQVVRNPARWLPYAVGLGVAVGLAVHVAMRLGGSRKRTRA